MCIIPMKQVVEALVLALICIIPSEQLVEALVVGPYVYYPIGAGRWRTPFWFLISIIPMKQVVEDSTLAFMCTIPSE